MNLPPIQPDLLQPIIVDIIIAAAASDTHEESAQALANLLANEVEVRINLWRAAAYGINPDFATQTDNAVNKALGIKASPEA
jgi:hypothetical protein